MRAHANSERETNAPKPQHTSRLPVLTYMTSAAETAGAKF